VGDCRRGARDSGRPRSCSWSDSIAEVDEQCEAIRLFRLVPAKADRSGSRCASIGERRSTGSWIAVAKPRDQWRAFGGPDAPTVEEGAQGHLGSSATTTARKWAKVLGTDHRASGELCGHSSMKVTPGRAQPPSFDEKGGPSDPSRREYRLAGTSSARRRGDRGVRSSTVHAVENAAVREHRPERFSSPRRQRGDRGLAGPKLDGRRQTHIDLGPQLAPVREAPP
jgi:hypothetical protein